MSQSSYATHRRAPRGTSILALLALATACEKKPPLPAPSKPDAAPAKSRGASLANPVLERAVLAVLERCQVNVKHGGVRCKDRSVLAALRRAEEQVGVDAALRAYCRGLKDEDPVVRAMAVRRISVNGRPETAEKASHEAQACLVEALRKAEDLLTIATLARVATYVSTALNKHETFLNTVATLGKREATLQALAAMWPHGRMRVWTRIEAAAKGEDPELRAAAQRSLARGAPANDEEREKVCGLLSSLLHHEAAATACGAVRLAARDCPAAKDEVIAAAAKLFAKKRFDATCAVALGADVAAHGSPWTAAQTRRISRLLGRAVTADRLGERVRGLALRTLARMDTKAAGRLAARYNKPGTPHFLRRAAEHAQREVANAAARAASEKKAGSRR